ncbi:hypothetical protein WA026_009054 [Henosepilachna vigintioctopunctata]
MNVVPPYGKRRFMDDYLIPEEYLECFEHEFQEWKGMLFEEYEALMELKDLMEPGSLSYENYEIYLHNCLWLEEEKSRKMLLKYNMENVKGIVCQSNYVAVEVPGLAERRPSLITGDLVRIRVHNDHIAYEGYIHKLQDRHVIVRSLDYELLDMLSEFPQTELDVSFQLGRVPLERAHDGIDRLYSKGLLNNLFPDNLDYVPYVKTYILEDEDFFNKNIVNNIEQKNAIEKIVNCSSGDAPYIVFGPPGTGKTVTIVEAICQLLYKTDKRILVCAPSNAACDLLTRKLMPFCSNEVLRRFYSVSRDWNTVPSDIEEYTNIQNGVYEVFDGSVLKDYRIVVTTLILIGRVDLQTYNADFVFIDEAAQATESDCTVAISALKCGGRIVLAGDPKQLGPFVYSSVAKDYGLNKSLLERLMNTQSIYANEDINFISMLKKNFRSHPDILKLPNELFYDSKLDAVSPTPCNDPISKIDVYLRGIKLVTESTENTTNMTKALEFYAISAQEQREGHSPSYFNTAEVNMVVQYIKALLALDLPPEFKVQPSDIGVISPYVRQVHKIEQKLLVENGIWDVEVGSVEAFQGREKRIIIISTVRAQHSLLNYDKKHALGFIDQKERFNVAITRAMSKLIVIGCPLVLETDPKWKNLIDACEKMNTYHGNPFAELTADKWQEILDRFKVFKSNK